MRVPLGGRRVRGYVVEVAERDPSGLKPIAGVSGELPIFGPKLRDALIWAAHYYVAPVSVMLERAGPPNLPGRPPRSSPPHPAVSRRAPHPLDELAAAVAAGGKRPPTALLASWEDMSWLEALAPVLAAGRSVMVVAATAAETRLIAETARRLLGVEVNEVDGELDDAAITSRWVRAATSPGVLVGTPRVAEWPVADLAVGVVIEEGRRAMKDRQTPTVAVRRMLMTRARLEGFTQVYVGPTPSLELLATGAEVVRSAPRAWPLVEVVDRNEEPPGGGLVTARARAAIRATVRAGGRVFVFTHRRGYAPAYRCHDCKELRRCPTCGSRPDPGEACSRCGTPSQPCLHCGGQSFEPLGAGVGRVLHELRGQFGDRAGEAGTDAPIWVGTERALAAVRAVDLAVAVDVDGLVLGTHFRAAEEALRVLARLAGRVRRGSGRRLMLQTAMPDQPVVAALRRGDPLEFLHQEMDVRRQMGYPPAAELLVVEVRGEAETADADLRSVAGDAAVMGPAERANGRRWLVQGSDLGPFKNRLRPLVQRWRDAGATVRIDVDPLDL